MLSSIHGCITLSSCCHCCLLPLQCCALAAACCSRSAHDCPDSVAVDRDTACALTDAPLSALLLLISPLSPAPFVPPVSLLNPAASAPAAEALPGVLTPCSIMPALLPDLLWLFKLPSAAPPSLPRGLPSLWPRASLLLSPAAPPWLMEGRGGMLPLGARGSRSLLKLDRLMESASDMRLMRSVRSDCFTPGGAACSVACCASVEWISANLRCRRSTCRESIA
jgi:hypothetical protein